MKKFTLLGTNAVGVKEEHQEFECKYKNKFINEKP
jgi:hypothetical protein